MSDEPDYPRVGEPLGRHDGLVQPHIIDTESTGTFMDYGYDTSELALEVAAEVVVNIRKSRKLLLKS
jgi:hypothetical protein